VRPVGSCAGHEPIGSAEYYEGYLAFVPDSLEALEALVGALPMPMNLWRNGWAISPRWIRGSFRKSLDTGKLVFFITLGGYPLSAQRKLLLDVAKSIARISTAQQTKHTIALSSQNIVFAFFSSIGRWMKGGLPIGS